MLRVYLGQVPNRQCMTIEEMGLQKGKTGQCRLLRLKHARICMSASIVPVTPYLLQPEQNKPSVFGHTRRDCDIPKSLEFPCEHQGDPLPRPLFG